MYVVVWMKISETESTAAFCKPWYIYMSSLKYYLVYLVDDNHVCRRTGISIDCNTISMMLTAIIKRHIYFKGQIIQHDDSMKHAIYNFA